MWAYELKGCIYWVGVACYAIPEDGVDVRLRFAGAQPAQAVLVNAAPGLPPAGESLQLARPATATTSQNGDQTIVMERVEL